MEALNLEPLLRESIGHHRSLLHRQQAGGAALKLARPSEIAALAAELVQLQQQAAKVDQTLLPLLAAADASIVTSPLFQERLKLLAASTEEIRLLLAGAEAGRAVAGAELQQFKVGRTALAGYNPGGRDWGKGGRGQA